MTAKAFRDDDRVYFHCPGCNHTHSIRYGGNQGWEWNGDLERPTFTPSILVRSTRLTEKGHADIEAWGRAGYPKHDEPFDSVPTVCHSFVTDGRIQYLTDSTHALAGQTVDLPEMEE